MSDEKIYSLHLISGTIEDDYEDCLIFYYFQASAYTNTIEAEFLDFAGGYHARTKHFPIEQPLEKDIEQMRELVIRVIEGSRGE